MNFQKLLKHPDERQTRRCSDFYHLIFGMMLCITAHATEAPTHCTPLALNVPPQTASSAAQVLYFWSPRMVGSVTQVRQAQRASAALGASFVPLLDPRIDKTEAKAALKTLPSATPLLGDLTVPCLNSLPDHALDHAPVMYVTFHNKLHPHRIMGIMPEAAWREAIAQRINDLRDAH